MLEKRINFFLFPKLHTLINLSMDLFELADTRNSGKFRKSDEVKSLLLYEERFCLASKIFR